MTSEALCTVEEAARRLNVHQATIRRMIKRGDLAARRVGRVWRIDPADLSPERLEPPARRLPQRVPSGHFAQIVRDGSHLPSAPLS